MLWNFVWLNVIALLPIYRCELKEFIKWKQVEYADPFSSTTNFIQYNNVPQGFSVYKDKVFVAIPRRRIGVPSTMNYVKLNGSDLYLNPKLHSYPNYDMNELDPKKQPNPNKIISVYRPRVDEKCERLWFVDSGTMLTGEPSAQVVDIQRPSIWVIDLKTDKVLSRYEIPSSVTANGRGLASLTIDSIDCSNNTFAYIPDLLQSSIVVYHLESNHSYCMQHNYFRMNPFEGDFDVDGLKFQWEDAIFSIALGKREKDSYRMAFFHPMSSFSEFAISTKILRNESLATRTYHFDDVKLKGRRGKNSQSTMHALHQNTGVMFFAEINKNRVTCWKKSRRALRPTDVHKVAQDNVTLIYPSDLNIIGDDLWVMSNRMIRLIYTRIDVNDYNFRIFRTPVKDAIKGTKCDAKRNQEISENVFDIDPRNI